MIKYLIAKKLGMTQLYDSSNVLTPVTILQAGPCTVTQLKTVEVDGYTSVQLGFSKQKSKNAPKGELGHAKKAGLDYAPAKLAEVRLPDLNNIKLGDQITINAFTSGELVDVTGITKGKGFQGVVKRFRVGGGPATHGSMFHRRIGSIGMRQTPGRTWKNQAMPGHMGSVQVTMQNLKLVKIDQINNLLLVKGAVPGANGDTVIVRTAIKGQPSKSK